MFEVNYYINRMPHRYEFMFHTALGATLKARAIYEEHGLAADVMDCQTGEIIAIFEPGNVWMCDSTKTLVDQALS